MFSGKALPGVERLRALPGVERLRGAQKHRREGEKGRRGGAGGAIPFLPAPSIPPRPHPRSSALTLQRSSRPELTLSALDTCSRSASGSSRYEAMRLGPAAPPPAGEAGEQGEPGALRRQSGVPP